MGGKEAEPVSISLSLPWAGWPPFLYTLQSLRLGRVQGAKNPTPGMVASLKVPWFCSTLIPPHLYPSHPPTLQPSPSNKTVSMRVGSMSQERASSLVQTPAKYASVR